LGGVLGPEKKKKGARANTIPLQSRHSPKRKGKKKKKGKNLAAFCREKGEKKGEGVDDRDRKVIHTGGGGGEEGRRGSFLLKKGAGNAQRKEKQKKREADGDVPCFPVGWARKKGGDKKKEGPT